jgi:hypothetical protein
MRDHNLYQTKLVLTNKKNLQSKKKSRLSIRLVIAPYRLINPNPTPEHLYSSKALNLI